jgi:hypothetical protein
MSDDEKQIAINDVLFVALVRDFESMAMVGFGKLVDPVSQEAERNLDRAKVAIDMLGMLDEKTRGNLDEMQVALMRQVLTNLRLNYVDELEKEKKEREKRTEDEGRAAAAGSAQAGEQAGKAPGEQAAGSGEKAAEQAGAGPKGSTQESPQGPDREAAAGAGGEGSDKEPEAAETKSRKRSGGNRAGGKTSGSREGR